MKRRSICALLDGMSRETCVCLGAHCRGFSFSGFSVESFPLRAWTGSENKSKFVAESRS